MTQQNSSLLNITRRWLPFVILMGLLVMAQAYVWPFTALVVH